MNTTHFRVRDNRKKHEHNSLQGKIMEKHEHNSLQGKDNGNMNTLQGKDKTET